MVAAAETLRSVNPATGAEIARYPAMPAGEVDAVLSAVAAAQPAWARTSVDERCAQLRAVARLLREEADRHAALITAEMGKPLSEARAEVEKCAFACEYFADHAAAYLAEEPAPSDGSRSYVHLEPLGTLLACMPWNFPYWQVFRCAAPALAAGNSVVLKHADNVSGCGLAIEALFMKAGFPAGVFRYLAVPVAGVADVIGDPRIAAVSLTGSTAAGRAVGATAGAALKRCVLELGGSDAFIVLDDADVDAAAETAVKSRFQNAGQSCIAAKRFIVTAKVARRFVDAVADRAERLCVGDPTVAETQMGPLARDDLRTRVEAQMEASLSAGARRVTGGRRPDGPGFFLTPAVLRECTPEMAVFTEETFGPVAAIMQVRDEDEAVAVANRSEYGLGGNVWTRDVERGLRIAHRLETGGVFVNGMTHSDPRLPFGGVKSSGHGRELHRYGIHEFVNVKTVWVGG